MHSLHHYFVHIFIFIVVFFNCQAQKPVNDACLMENGTPGQCVRVEMCPSAIKLVRTTQGVPKQCGFEGNHPIVCCETKVQLRQRQVGDKAKQICSEIYQLLPATTTTEPTFILEALPAKPLVQDPKMARIKLASIKLSPDVHHVVGGVNARPATFPHMAALGYGDKPNITWGCGGTLISEKYVLTAAHCIHTARGKVKYVRLGDLDIGITTDLAKPQDFDVALTIVHPKYRAPSKYNDIAIIELSAHAEYNYYVRPGCLFTETDIPDVPWSATGWGAVAFQGEQANHLQHVFLRPFTLESCQKSYASTSKRKLANGIDFNSQICAGENYKDTCQGDSGGPLQIEHPQFNKGYQVIGITSFGIACGIGDGPSVYTRVSHYIEWIESVVWPE